jgi:hypothetical protein
LSIRLERTTKYWAKGPACKMIRQYRRQSLCEWLDKILWPQSKQMQRKRVDFVLNRSPRGRIRQTHFRY